MPSLSRLEELRADLFADDLEIRDEMCDWAEADFIEYLESGGATLPASSQHRQPTEESLASAAAGSSRERRAASSGATLP